MNSKELKESLFMKKKSGWESATDEEKGKIYEFKINQKTLFLKSI